MKSIDVDELIHLIELNLDENTYALSKKIFIEMAESSKGEPIDVVYEDKVLIKMEFEYEEVMRYIVRFNPFYELLCFVIEINDTDPGVGRNDRRKQCIRALKQLKNGEQI